MRHLVIDADTGRVSVQGRDHTLYTVDEVADAERRAAAGDEEAIALIESLEIGDGSGVVDMQQLLHDCPECRAAMARGEQPTIMGAEEVAALQREIRRKKKRPMRWRHQKRRPR